MSESLQPPTAARQASLSITNSRSLLKLTSIDSVMPSNHLIVCPPPAFNLPQHQGLFQWVSSSHQVAKVLAKVFSNSPSKEYSGLISFRMDWLDLLAVQGTLKSLLQHHISKASILRHSAFFIVQLSHPHRSNYFSSPFSSLHSHCCHLSSASDLSKLKIKSLSFSSFF